MTDITASAAKAKGSPALIILLIVIVGPALAVGVLLGAGGASILGGFVAMFSLIATLGGPLRAGLRRLLAIGPLIAVSAVAPRLLAEWSTVAAFALILILVFVAGLLPLRGRSFDSVALGLGMGTLLGYSLPLTGTVQAGQVVLAAVVGLALALVLRVLMGASDPTGPTRKAIADLLDETSSDLAAAFDAWSSDRPAQWLGDVLLAAGRYRLARRTLEARTVDAGAALADAAARAQRLAAIVRMKKRVSDEALDVSGPERLNIEVQSDDRLAADALHSMRSALDDVEHALEVRRATVVDVPQGLRSRVNLAAVRTAIRHGSVQVRHAIRSTLAVLLALLVSTRLTHGDPLLSTLLMTTFGIVQVSWRSTLARARDRLLGVLAGGVLVVLILLVVPPALLLPIALIAMAVGMWFITARPAVGTAGLIVMSVGLNTELRHLDPWQVGIEYVVLTVIALLIGGVLGFVMVPAWRPRPLAERVTAAARDAASALTALGRDHHGHPGRLEAFNRAQNAALQLVPDHERISPDQQHELDLLRATVQELLTTALFLSSSGGSDAAELTAAALALGEGIEGAASTSGADAAGSAVVLLADQVAAQRSKLIGTL